MPVAIREKLLTDKRIFHYMLRGFYGPERQAEAEEELRAAKRAKRTPRPPKLSAAESILSDLL